MRLGVHAELRLVGSYIWAWFCFLRPTACMAHVRVCVCVCVRARARARASECVKVGATRAFARAHVCTYVRACLCAIVHAVQGDALGRVHTRLDKGDGCARLQHVDADDHGEVYVARGDPMDVARGDATELKRGRS